MILTKNTYFVEKTAASRTMIGNIVDNKTEENKNKMVGEIARGKTSYNKGEFFSFFFGGECSKHC